MKDTLMWILFSGLYLSFKVADNSNPKTFAEVFKDTFNIMVVFEFLYNVYTFPILIELIVIFVLTLVGLMVVFTDVFPEKDKEGKVNKIMKCIQTYMGINIFIFLVREIIINYKTLLQSQLKSFTLPIVFTVFFIPYLYYLVAWTRYDMIEVELKQNKNLNFFKKLYFRIRVRLHCKMNRNKIINFKKEKKNIIRNMSTWSEIGQAF